MDFIYQLVYRNKHEILGIAMAYLLQPDLKGTTTSWEAVQEAVSYFNPKQELSQEICNDLAMDLRN